jgi:hypothetical protein
MPLAMTTHRILASLFVLASLAMPLAAQRLEIGFDRGGIDVRAALPLGGRCGPILQIGGRFGGCDDVHVCRSTRVWVPGCQRIEHIPARYGWRRDACGRMVQYCISPAYDRVIEEPGYWDWRGCCDRVVGNDFDRSFHRGFDRARSVDLRRPSIERRGFGRGRDD